MYICILYVYMYICMYAYIYIYICIINGSQERRGIIGFSIYVGSMRSLSRSTSSDAVSLAHVPSSLRRKKGDI